MLLVIDVGNTNTVFGLFSDGTLAHSFRISTIRTRTSDELGLLIRELIERKGLDPTADISGVILASVVPPLNRSLLRACRDSFGQEPLVVGPGIKTGMKILTDQPSEVGADRIVNAVAAWHRFQRGLIVVDFGTATTFDAVSDKGDYLGGAIAPGIDISMDALFRHAAKLPRVELEDPGKVIGKNTVRALQSGLFFGYVGLVDEIVARMKAELPFETKVLATGGLADHFASASKAIEEVDELLTLEGLRILYEHNRPAAATPASRRVDASA